MRRIFLSAMVSVFPALAAQAQPAINEPPEFPSAIPGPSAQTTGGGCFLLARGTITPGDRDWVRVTIPWPSSQTIVDVDFPTGGTAGSALTASVVGGSSGFNIADNNVARDAGCGLFATSSPVGSTRDSAVTLGATARNAVVNIGVTGAEDTGFTGAHNQNFAYDLWVSIVPTTCTSDAGCNDNIACTIDRCTIATGLCSNTPDASLCDNGRFCDGQELCNATSGCRPGTPPSCNDGVSCTVDACDGSLDECVHLADDDLCDDGSFCNGLEWCDEQDDCQDDAPADCDDGIACTVDVCDDDQGRCQNTPVDTRCNNGLYCDGVERCDAAVGCVSGTPPACADAVGCTVDVCDEALDRCAHTPDDRRCDDGRFCDGAERCDAALGCLAGTAPTCDDGVACTSDSCDSVTDRCENAADDSLCDDGQFCNGMEQCDAARGCRPGPVVDCDDGLACTLDSCDDAAGQCEHRADDARCDNGLFCDGQEACDPQQGCVSGNVPCEDGSCREDRRSCSECDVDADCDDGDLCNGVETCNEDGICVGGTPPCDDGASCNPRTGECATQRDMTFDFQPRRCPNRMNGEEQFVNAAIVSVGGFDVREIRVKTLKLLRIDGMGHAVSPMLEARDRRPSVEDVTSPHIGDPCGCALARADGVKDLLIRFDGDETWKGLKLGRTRRGETVQLKLTGLLRDGTPFELHDCLTVGRGAGAN